MKYASTIKSGATETIVLILDLSHVPLFDPENPHPQTYAVDDDVQIGYDKQEDGSFIAPALTAEQIQAQTIATYQSAAQNLLDSVAKSWGYDSVVSAASYASSTNAQFKAEALALITWRDEVWGSAYALLASIEGGKKSAPKSVDDFLAGLPLAPDRPVA
ncbi:MAG: hypothetical protein V4536_08895 [Pseudomonadota bacterium]